jgi:hypothetical protein
MRRILRVIAVYEPFGEVAVEVLSDQTIADTVRDVENPDEIRALVDSAIARENAHLRRKLEEAMKQQSVASPSTPVVGEPVASAKEDVIAELGSKIDRLAGTLAAGDTAKATEEDRKKTRRATFWAIVKTTLVASVIGAACYLLLHAYLSAPWATKPLKVTTAVVATLVDLYLGLRKFVIEKVAGVLDWAIRVITVVGAIYAVVSWIVGSR